MTDPAAPALPLLATPLEVALAAEEAIGSVRTHSEAWALIRALRDRIALAAEAGEVKLVERIKVWRRTHPSIEADALLRDCLAALACQPPAVDVEALVDLVAKFLREWRPGSFEPAAFAATAIRGFFARQPPAVHETQTGESPDFERGLASCLMHRCTEHMGVPQLNRKEASGAECGACAAQPTTVAAPLGEVEETIAALEIDGESGRVKEVRWPSLPTRIRSLVITPYPNRDEAERSAIAFAVEEVQRQNESLRTQLAEAERERDEARAKSIRIVDQLDEADAIVRDHESAEAFKLLGRVRAYLSRYPQPIVAKSVQPSEADALLRAIAAYDGRHDIGQLVAGWRTAVEYVRTHPGPITASAATKEATGK